jgi:hypothetical protein
VVLLRFVPRESDDPIDPRSFRATVDGVDRTASFRVSDHDAWGPLANGAPNDVAEAQITSGSHTLGVRVCSVRGADPAVPHLALDASHATARQRAVGGLAGA